MVAAKPGVPSTIDTLEKGSSLGRDALRRLAKNRAAVVAAVVLTALILACILVPSFSHWRYDQAESLAYLTFLLEHEYGHHIQALAGILKAEYQWQLPLSGVDLSLQGSLRIELQANCLSGVSLGADQDTYLLDAQDLTNWQAVVRNFIDPKRDHGSTENAASWSLAGFDAANPQACNTFTAPTPLVA